MHEPHMGPVYFGAQVDLIDVATSQLASGGTPRHASTCGQRVTSAGEPGYDQNPDNATM